MYKVVNMKNYRFGTLKNIQYVGFGIINLDTNTFVSLDGFKPYVLDRKYIMQSVVDSGCCEDLKKVSC